MTPPSSDALVAAALDFVGTPYLWGGKTPDGFDCSGLITYSAGLVGVPFGGNSSMQINACTPISVEEGFATPGALLWREGHDAISTGRGETVEAIGPYVAVLGDSRTYDGGKTRFTRAGLIPGLDYSTPGQEADMATSPAKGNISSSFGNRPIYGFHAGVDIAGGGKSTVVYAAVALTVVRVVRGRKPGQPSTSGTVLAPGRSPNGLVGKHGSSVHSLYGHVTVDSSIKAGTKLKAGQRIGVTDLSGITSGYHLHFETWKNSSPSSYYDPKSWAKANGVTLGATPKAYSTPTPAKPTTRYPNGPSGITLVNLKSAWYRFLRAKKYTGNTETMMQKWLKASGHYKGAIDGKFGPMSITALQARLKGAYAGDSTKKLLDPGPADGIRGTMTRKAEQAYLGKFAYLVK